MNPITTKLVPDGNSMAIRVPKQVLALSGLSGTVQLSVKHGQITIQSPRNPRIGWSQQIEHELSLNGHITLVDEYGDMAAENEVTLADGLDT